jgi:tRNA pseudouridine55 synthase
MPADERGTTEGAASGRGDDDRRGGRRAEGRRPRPDGPSRPTAADGLVVVDKPAGWTSHDVVGRLRGLAATRKVGHAGTLDPMATGVLVVGVGRATRLLTYLVGADKEYAATIRLGVATTTDDAEGELVAAPGASRVTRSALEAAVGALTGELWQVPSSVSAIKVDGQRAYALVRAGEQVELAARPVTVSRFDVLAVRQDEAPGPDGSVAVPVLDVDVLVACSSGTYVRALARDLGVALGCGGHLTALRRTRVGGFTLDDARTLDALAAEPVDAPLTVLPMADAARAAFRARDLSDDEARALGHGRPLEPTGEPGPVAAIAPDGSLVALLDDRDGRARPLVVFAPG